MDEEGIARKFWIKFRNDSVVAMYTPFLVCLASGKLDSDAFLHCISQDFHFLKAFSQAYSTFSLFISPSSCLLLLTILDF